MSDLKLKGESGSDPVDHHDQLQVLFSSRLDVDNLNAASQEGDAGGTRYTGIHGRRGVHETEARRPLARSVFLSASRKPAAADSGLLRPKLVLVGVW
jgi:hypothetical protein